MRRLWYLHELNAAALGLVPQISPLRSRVPLHEVRSLYGKVLITVHLLYMCILVYTEQGFSMPGVR